ncbi:F-box only protein 31-like isoform X1 [Centruroides vittatus]|uniref:F-box only protein 31-like isoform X1 n=2 Tax=Centruroides vittatus TaxID=120091 RepID=UPI00350F2469
MELSFLWNKMNIFGTSKRHLPKSKTMSFGRLVRETSSAMLTITLSIVNVVLGKDKEMTLKIDDLPIEIIAHIFTFLSAEDLNVVSSVSRRFYEATLLESIWIIRCRKDFNVPIKKFSGFLYRDLYTKVLYQYRSLIGLWQSDVPSYGGLLEVKFENGKLIGTQLYPPQDPYINRPLRRKPLFSIGIDSNDEKIVLCTVCENSHKAEVEMKENNEFHFKCLDIDTHKSPNSRHQALIDWLVEETADALDLPQFPRSQELLLMKYLILEQYKYNCKFHRINCPTTQRNVPIQPGLFKGTYGAHGLEIIILQYEDCGTKATAFKVSGDPNVPAGQVTFQVDLSYPMVLAPEQQQQMALLDELKVFRMSPSLSLNLPAQPFYLPVDCYERYRQIPRMCTSRYHALGQIAGQGFINPSFSRGHWIIFNEDLFGFLWLDLLSLSMYHRVQNLCTT